MSKGIQLYEKECFETNNDFPEGFDQELTGQHFLMANVLLPQQTFLLALSALYSLIKVIETNSSESNLIKFHKVKLSEEALERQLTIMHSIHGKYQIPIYRIPKNLEDLRSDDYRESIGRWGLIFDQETVRELIRLKDCEKIADDHHIHDFIKAKIIKNFYIEGKLEKVFVCTNGGLEQDLTIIIETSTLGDKSQREIKQDSIRFFSALAVQRLFMSARVIAADVLDKKFLDIVNNEKARKFYKNITEILFSSLTGVKTRQVSNEVSTIIKQSTANYRKIQSQYSRYNEDNSELRKAESDKLMWNIFAALLNEIKETTPSDQMIPDSQIDMCFSCLVGRYGNVEHSRFASFLQKHYQIIEV